MAYVATLAARISQLGVTIADFNLVDGAGVMPAQRVVWKFKTETPTTPQINTAKTTMIANATADYDAAQIEAANKVAFRDKLTDYIEGKLDTLRSDYLAAVAANGQLTAQQKTLARTVAFSWRLG